MLDKYSELFTGNHPLIYSNHCSSDSNYVLESDPITLYGVAGSRILVLPRKVNGTRLEWKVQTGYKAFVKRVYRRLWIVNATQFAGASVWYDLTRNGTTVYTSAKGTVQVGSIYCPLYPF